MHPNITTLTADITKLDVCAIVNAANSSLMGGGGVDGAIHRAGGGAILEACRTIRQGEYPDGLPTGEVVATTAGKMPARYVIHTVGPIYSHCGDRCAELLASCHTHSLQLADQHNCDAIAFPAISTGIYGYPKEEAARVAYAAAEEYLVKSGSAIKVLFVFHGAGDETLFRQAIEG